VSQSMPQNIVLVLADAAEADVVRRSLESYGDSVYTIQWVSRCFDALELLGTEEGVGVAAVVVDPSLPDRRKRGDSGHTVPRIAPHSDPRLEPRARRASRKAGRAARRPRAS